MTEDPLKPLAVPVFLDDLDQVRASGKDFGEAAQDAYRALILQAVRLLLRAPKRPSSKAREELGEGFRSFRLALVAKRGRSARHVIFYRPNMWEPGSYLTFLRLLHERRDPTTAVSRALDEEAQHRPEADDDA